MSGNSNDNQIGYLTKAIEDLASMVKSHMDKEEGDRSKLDARLSKIEEDISLARWIVKVIKVLFWTGVFLLTFKFGDIKTLWTNLHIQ